MSSSGSETDYSYDSSDSEVWEADDVASNAGNDEQFQQTLLYPSTTHSSSSYSDKSYSNADDGPPLPLPKFLPARFPGPQLPDEAKTQGGHRKYIRAIDFFTLFFTDELIKNLCDFTNDNARLIGPTKPSMFNAWEDVTRDTMYRFLGLLMYMGVVQAPNIERYWSTKSLYHGLWARSFMTRKRFKQIMCFLKTAHPNRVPDETDKLDKIRFLFEHIRSNCQQYFQPNQNMSIDERIVRNKGRYFLDQNSVDKPSKRGLKLWVLADSITGYTYNFDVHMGKSTECSLNGLAYDVVFKLAKSIMNQGYRLYFDYFFTSVQLLKDLLLHGILACGPVNGSSKGFPSALKNTKEFEKWSIRGDMRWHRDECVLTVQWKDNKTVTFMSTMHNANISTTVQRKTKQSNNVRNFTVKQPEVVKDYYLHMTGVDKSSQLINKYNILRKTNKWWKSLFFHLIDIARINSYILFQDFRQKNSDIPELNRSKIYGQLDFTEELIRQLGQLSESEEIPSRKQKITFITHNIIPVYCKKRRYCKLCYLTEKRVVNIQTKCGKCDVYLCFNGTRNCLLQYHEMQ